MSSRQSLPFVRRVEIFYPEDMKDDAIVVLLCPYLSKGGKFLRDEEKCRIMYRLLKGSTIRYGRRHALLHTPTWLWNLYLRRSAEEATGTSQVRSNPSPTRV